MRLPLGQRPRLWRGRSPSGSKAPLRGTPQHFAALRSTSQHFAALLAVLPQRLSHLAALHCSARGACSKSSKFEASSWSSLQEPGGAPFLSPPLSPVSAVLRGGGSQNFIPAPPRLKSGADSSQSPRLCSAHPHTDSFTHRDRSSAGRVLLGGSQAAPAAPAPGPRARLAARPRGSSGSSQREPKVSVISESKQTMRLFTAFQHSTRAQPHRRCQTRNSRLVCNVPHDGKGQHGEDETPSSNGLKQHGVAYSTAYCMKFMFIPASWTFAMTCTRRL